MFVQYAGKKKKEIWRRERGLLEMFSLKIGRSFRYRGEELQIIKIYSDCFLAIDSNFSIKRFPKFEMIK